MRATFRNGSVIVSGFSNERNQYLRIFGAKLTKYGVSIPITHQAVWKEVDDLLQLHKASVDSEYASQRHLRRFIPFVPGKIGNIKLYPFQVDGVKFALQNKRVLIADDMGLGKTIQSLSVVSIVKPKHVLVICPKAVLYNWQYEAERFGFMPTVFTNPKDVITEFTIVNYDRLVSSFVFFNKIPWDFIIVDESHYIKERTTKRFKCVTELTKRADYVLLLSGTPQPNYPYELWGQLHAIDPARFSSFYTFAKRFCNYRKSRWGYDYRGISDSSYLRYLLSYYMISRKKRDVLKQLPELERQKIFVNVQRDKRYKQAIRKVYDELMRSNPNERAYPHIAHLRLAMGIMKVPFVIDFVTMLMEYPNNVVIVYAHHHLVIDMLADGLKNYGALVLDGRVSKEAQSIVERFQNGESRIIILSSAGGLGINLQRANVVVFAEREWTPSLEDQIEARAWRIGNENDVVVSYYIVGKGFDERIQATLDMKRNLQTITVKDVIEMIKFDL